MKTSKERRSLGKIMREEVWEIFCGMDPVEKVITLVGLGLAIFLIIINVRHVVGIL